MGDGCPQAGISFPLNTGTKSDFFCGGKSLSPQEVSLGYFASSSFVSAIEGDSGLFCLALDRLTLQ